MLEDPQRNNVMVGRETVRIRPKTSDVYKAKFKEGKLTISDRLYDYFARVYAVLAGNRDIDRFLGCLVESFLETEDVDLEIMAQYRFKYIGHDWRLEVWGDFDRNSEAIRCDEHMATFFPGHPPHFVVYMTARLYAWMMEFIREVSRNNPWRLHLKLMALTILCNHSVETFTFPTGETPEPLGPLMQDLLGEIDEVDNRWYGDYR